MNTKMKKAVAGAVLGTFAFGIASPALAVEANNYYLFSKENVESSNLEYFYTLDINKMNSEQKKIYQEVIEQAIQKYSTDDNHFDEDEFIRQVNTVLYMMEYGIPISRSLVSVSNDVVATAVNVAVALVTGGVASAAIKAYVKKVGINAAIDAITDKVIIALAAFGISNVTGIKSIIKGVVNNALDPGSAIAEWLDNRDSKPGNGSVEIG